MRKKLCEEIAYMWVDAENVYTDSDCKNSLEKDKVLEYQKSKNLSDEETELMEDIASTMGV